MIQLLVKQVDDEIVQENFKRIQDFFNIQYLMDSFKFYEFSVPGARVHYKFKHNMTSIPKDVIILSVIGGDVTFNYSLFDRDYIDITTSAASTIRCFIGTYKGTV